MKKLVIALMCLVFAKSAFAQKDLLSFNEQNKYIYYQVVEEPALSADTLQARALYFLKTAYPRNKVVQDEANGFYTGKGKFIIMNGTLLKHIDGEINYTFHIECKDQKYRYWLTDFVFTPYKVDRYGNSVPQQGIDIPLEDGPAKLDKSQFDGYLNETGSFCKQFGDKLKQYMVRASALKKADKRKVIDTKNW